MSQEFTPSSGTFENELNRYYDSIEGLVSPDEVDVFLDGSLNQPWTDTKGNPKDEGSTEKVVEYDIHHADQLLYKGLLQNFKKETSLAIASFEQAYKIYMSKNQITSALSCLLELAWIHYLEEDTSHRSQSNRYFSKAIKLIHLHMHEPGINEIRARLLHYQGLVQYAEKKYGQAVKSFLHAKTFCAINSLDFARITDSLAIHYEQTQDYFRALQCLNDALTIKKTHPQHYEQAFTLQIMGRIYLLQEDHDKAAECLDLALSVSLSVDDRYRCGFIKNELVRLSIYQNNLEKAQCLILELEADCQGKDMRVLFAKSQFYKAYIYYLSKKYDLAMDVLLSNSLPAFKKYNSKEELAIALRLMACIHHHQGDDTRAVQEMSEVIAIFKEQGNITELAKTYYELGRIYLGLNEKKLALACFMETLRIAECNGLNFIISHIEDEIFRLDENKWLDIVEKRANHDRIFEKQSTITEALNAIGQLEGTDNTETDPLQSPNKRLISLLRVGQAMTAERDLDKLLCLLKTETEQALEADRCTVFLYDKEKNELWSKLSTGFDSTEEIRFPAHLGLVGYVVKTGETLNIPNAYEDPRFNTDIDRKTGYRTQNILCLPMRNRQMQIIGAFQVLNKRKSHFDKVDEDLLMAISTNAGVAIENTQLSKEIKISFDSFVKTLSSTIDARDPITAGHSQRVAKYAVLLGEEMELDNDNLEALQYASLLHDIGKIGIREDVLKKDGRLTDREYSHIQTHVSLTHEILKNVHFESHLKQVPEIAASHHEKVDGTGYYRGLKGNEILLPGRILAISDVFDAITSKRHYRNRMAFDKVLGILKRDAGSHFDSDCIDNFFRVQLFRLAHILLMEDTNKKSTPNLQQLLVKMDKMVTVGDYFAIMEKETLAKEEALIHEIFSTIYHQ